MLGQQALEGGQVLGFLIAQALHLSGQGGGGGRSAEHQGLGAVDLHRRHLARVIHAQNLVHPRLGGAGAGPGRNGFGVSHPGAPCAGRR